MARILRPGTRASIVGGPARPLAPRAQAYLQELVRGEISVNPEMLARAYFKLAEESDGLKQLAYCALGWAVSSRNAEGKAIRKIKALEQRVADLEKRLKA